MPLLGIKLHDGKDSFSSTLLDTAPVRWVGAENQFFTILLTPKADHLIDHVEFQCFNQRDPKIIGIAPFPPGAPPDIEGRAFFPGPEDSCRADRGQHLHALRRPKDFDRLNTLASSRAS